MDVMLQRHCAKYIYVVPEGLRELMTDISREVLRTQPENMYTYIADYLDALMITRENARVAARLIQSITEIATTTVDFLKNTGMDREAADHVVEIIQGAFKNYLQLRPVGTCPEVHLQSEDVEEANILTEIMNQIVISSDKYEEAARIIQQAFRTFKSRREAERELLCGMIDWRVAARSAIHLYRHAGVTYEEANRAATLIKAAYKGYYTRRIMKKLAEEGRYLNQLEQHFEEIYGEGDDSQDGGKAVRIDYDTVIPHVDFDEAIPAAAKIPKEESTTEAVVSYAIERILDTTFMEAQKKDPALAETIETIPYSFPEASFEEASYDPIGEMEQSSVEGMEYPVTETVEEAPVEEPVESPAEETHEENVENTEEN